MMRVLRLCVVADPNSPVTVRVVSPLVARGHQVHLIGDRPVRRPWPGVCVHSPSRLLSHPKASLPLVALWARVVIRRLQPDVLHAHQIHRGGWIGLVSGYHPWAVTAWGSDLLLQTDRSPLHRALNRATLRQADLVLVPSAPLYRRALELDAAPGKVHLLPWPVDTAIFCPGNDPRTLREQLGLREDEPLVLSPRALAPLYNIDVIVQAMAQVIRRIPLATLLILDHNPQPAYRGRLLDLIARLRLENRVRWLPPAETPSQMAALYRLADVVVSIPSSEGLSFSVLEAMACGVPVVISALPAFEGWVAHEANGLIVPVRDAAATAQAMIRLLEDAALRQAMATRNSRQVREQADQTAWVEQMEALYYSLHP